jgi:hypothetical protein
MSRILMALAAITLTIPAVAETPFERCEEMGPAKFEECVRTRAKSVPGYRCDGAKDCRETCQELLDNGTLRQICIDKAELAAHRARKAQAEQSCPRYTSEVRKCIAQHCSGEKWSKEGYGGRQDCDAACQNESFDIIRAMELTRRERCFNNAAPRGNR